MRIMEGEAAIGWGIVKGREELAPGYVRLRLTFRAVAERARPGQFVHVHPVPRRSPAALRGTLPPDDRLDPFLRRPFSVHDADRASGEFAILFKVIGRGTRELANAQTGDALNVMGPLGRGFPDRVEPAGLETPVGSTGAFLGHGRQGPGSIIVVGGGVGVAPFILAAKEFSRDHSVIALVGGRTAQDVLCTEDLDAAGAEVHTATEDGSLGFAGQVTELLERLLDEGLRGVILACGPMPMIRKVAEIGRAAGLPAFLSLEDRLGCGLGACLGCALRVIERDGSRRYMRLCSEGPVVEAERVDFDGV